MDVKGSHDERTYQKADQRIKIIVPKRSDNHAEMCVNFSSFKPDMVYTFGTSNAQSIAYCEAFNRIAPSTLIPSNSSSK